MEYKKGSRSIYDIQYHFVWTTKYRYHVLKGNIAKRLIILLRQGCEARGITIIRGNISKEHVQMLISCLPIYSPAKIVQYLKGRSSKHLQEEFPELKQKYWGQHLWGRGYFCGTVGAVTEEMIKTYVENQGEEKGEDIFKITD